MIGKRHLLGSSIALIGSRFTWPAFAQQGASAAYVIKNVVQPANATLFDANVNGLRDLTNTKQQTSSDPPFWNLPAAGIVASAYNLAAVRSILVEAGLSEQNASISDTDNAVSMVRQIAEILKANREIIQLAVKDEPGSWLVSSSNGLDWARLAADVPPSPESYKLNDVAVVTALAADAIDISAPVISTANNMTAYPLKRGPALELIKAQESMVAISNTNSIDVAAEYQGLSDSLNRYDSFSKQLLVYLGKITFGFVTPLTAEEMQFDIPRAIQREFSCAWLEFNVTFRDLERWSLSELGFNVDLPNGCYAFEIAPLRYGPSVKVEDTIKTPEIKINEISVGEFFGKKMAYDYIKPVVVGLGRGESAVTWILTGEAVALGSHVFGAIVGVPKGTTMIHVGLSAHVKVSKWFPIGGSIGATEIERRRIIL